MKNNGGKKGNRVTDKELMNMIRTGKAPAKSKKAKSSQK